MKRLFLLLALVAMVASSCTRDDTNIWDKLNDQEDVCSSMDDVMFMEYCYQNFDVNKDGKVSPFEARSVRSINIEGLEIYSIKGVEYFEILESINAGGTPLRNVDLSFNNLLTSFGFSGCGSMTSMVLPKNIITITSSAFSGCVKLEKINIPDSVTTIGDYAFNGCTSLTSVTIPDSVTTIGWGAFYDCISLTSVYCKTTTPPSLGSDAFKYWNGSYSVNVPYGCDIYVPTGSVSAYKSAEGWSDYAYDIVGYDF